MKFLAHSCENEHGASTGLSHWPVFKLGVTEEQMFL
jgi:hypothetical protein